MSERGNSNNKTDMANHILMHRTDWWSARATEWIPKARKGSQGRMMVRLGYNINKKAGVKWYWFVPDSALEIIGRHHCPTVDMEWAEGDIQ